MRSVQVTDDNFMLQTFSVDADHLALIEQYGQYFAFVIWVNNGGV